MACGVPPIGSAESWPSRAKTSPWRKASDKTALFKLKIAGGVGGRAASENQGAVKNHGTLYARGGRRGSEDLRTSLGINVAGMIGRAWLVGLTILAVGLAGEREDGVMAAVLILAAFTVYFSMTLLLRSLERSSTRP